MLNIRINLSIDIKKLGVVMATLAIAFSNLIAPPSAQALERTFSAFSEKPVTVNLTYLTVTTTKSQARASIASSESKYFDTEALAFLTVYAKDWKMGEWKCLRQLWQHESHFNPKALNKHSGAYGVAQFLPSTWGNYSVSKTAEAKLQIKYGLRYIEKRYGTACEAWAFWQKNGWY